jgi:hypothetical protein
MNHIGIYPIRSDDDHPLMRAVFSFFAGKKILRFFQFLKKRRRRSSRRRRRRRKRI